MAATLCRNVQSLGMAVEADVLAFVSRLRFQQLVFIVGGVRVMALDAIANRRRMNGSFEGRSIFVRMTGQAESLRCRGRELYARYVFVGANFVTRQTSSRDRRMHRFAFGLICVALKALGAIDFRIERHRVHASARTD